MATTAPATTEAPAATTAPAATQAPTGKYTFGMLMVGPYNDHGWSEAHYDAAQYVLKNVPNTDFIYLDKVNAADRPGTTESQLAEELLSKGAKLIIFNSDAMQDEGAVDRQAKPAGGGRRHMGLRQCN